MGVYSDLEIALQEEEADRVLRRRDLRGGRRETYRRRQQDDDMPLILFIVVLGIALGFVVGLGVSL